LRTDFPEIAIRVPVWRLGRPAILSSMTRRIWFPPNESERLMFAHQNFFLRCKYPRSAIFRPFLRVLVLGEFFLFQFEFVAVSEGRSFAPQQLFELRTSRFCAIHHA
jgi:hypothetical protein